MGKEAILQSPSESDREGKVVKPTPEEVGGFYDRSDEKTKRYLEAHGVAGTIVGGTWVGAGALVGFAIGGLTGGPIGAGVGTAIGIGLTEGVLLLVTANKAKEMKKAGYA